MFSSGRTARFFPLIAVLFLDIGWINGEDDFDEFLLIRPLRDGMVSANFRFTSLWKDDIESLYLGMIVVQSVVS